MTNDCKGATRGFSPIKSKGVHESDVMDGSHGKNKEGKIAGEETSPLRKTPYPRDAAVKVLTG